MGLQFQLAKQYRIPVHLWLQTTDLSTVRNQQYRSFLANVEANGRGGSDILIHAADTDEFVRYISGKLDTAPKPSKGAEQLAVVCSNARVGQVKCDELQHTVTEALREADPWSRGYLFGRLVASGHGRGIYVSPYEYRTILDRCVAWAATGSFTDTEATLASR